MLRKTTGLEEVLDVVDTICVTFEDVVPTNIPAFEDEFGEPAFEAQPRPVVNTSPNNDTEIVEERPRTNLPPVGVLFVEVVYFDPIQQRIVQKFVACRQGTFGTGGVGWPQNVGAVTILTPGGCG